MEPINRRWKLTGDFEIAREEPRRGVELPEREDKGMGRSAKGVRRRAWKG